MHHKPLPPTSEEAKTLKTGLYKHYKGKHYELLHIARHSETLEEYVVYKALYGNYDIWVRPLKMFCEMVFNKEGEQVPRFEHVEKF